jgi:hypothetical protein
MFLDVLNITIDAEIVALYDKPFLYKYKMFKCNYVISAIEV